MGRGAVNQAGWRKAICGSFRPFDYAQGSAEVSDGAAFIDPETQG
jgi:hypothetical protein